MIRVLSTNIVSPLGFTSEENYQSIRSGKTGLCQYENPWGIPETITASLFSEEQNRKLKTDGLSRFESLVFTSVKDAMSKVPFDMLSNNTVFILSSTKGNIEALSEGNELTNLALSAKKISGKLGFSNEPIVVCNACISGAAAQLLAWRLIHSGRYDYAVVCGADCQSKFIVSGFSSLKALSPEPCRPFDMERYGLNLGEAAATIILGKERPDECRDSWYMHAGAIRNDAVHISNPSKTAEGAIRAIRKALPPNPLVSLISLHGTATLYNDQMEAVALKRTSLDSVPAMALKGYFGHTMGAAGILETIISIYATEDHQALPTKGFSELGVSANIGVSNRPQPISGNSILKMIAGFGGCNAALFFSKDKMEKASSAQVPQTKSTHHVRITPHEVLIDGNLYDTKETGMSLLTELYKKEVNDYPKYYKMDGLSKLAFVASELLLKAEGNKKDHSENRSVILFNHSSSISSDLAFEVTIDSNDYFPSPSVFVYTLPNIATGEIAIRNTYYGETSFYILSHKMQEKMDEIVNSSFWDEEMQSSLCGWIDFQNDSNFEADLYIKERILN
ncbi:MAG: beta-ketoacyl synthase N-terminal-like domain-containing protein [Alloprevotella sp.]